MLSEYWSRSHLKYILRYGSPDIRAKLGRLSQQSISDVMDTRFRVVVVRKIVWA